MQIKGIFGDLSCDVSEKAELQQGLIRTAAIGT